MKKLRKAKTFKKEPFSENWQIYEKDIEEIKKEIYKLTSDDGDFIIDEEQIDMVCFTLNKLNYLELTDLEVKE